MQVLIEKVANLTPVQYQACYRANYGTDGYMRETLVKHRRDKDSAALAILLIEQPAGVDFEHKHMLGWALLTPVTTSRDSVVAGTWYTKKRSKYTAQFWVKRQYRGKGLGSLLLSETQKLDPRPHVFPHDDRSGKMFGGKNVTVLKVDQYWIKTAKAS